MMKNEKDIIAACLSEFKTSVLMHDEFSTKDATVANRHYATYIKALKRLNKIGNDGFSALATLLEDENQVVRVTTACYLIHRYPEKAIKVLTEAAEAQRSMSSLAIMTLKRWELGRYLDPASGKEVELKKPQK